MTEEEENVWLDEQHGLDKNIADTCPVAWKHLALAMRAELEKNHYSLALCLEVKKAETALREMGELPPYVPPENNNIWIAVPLALWPFRGRDPYSDAVDLDKSLIALRDRLQLREDYAQLMVMRVEKKHEPLTEALTAQTALPGCLCTWRARDPSCPVHGEKEIPEPV